jgi:Ni/Co efflux regulator RcnB
MTGDMRRLISLLVAATIAAGPLAAAGGAEAKDDHREARREQSQAAPRGGPLARVFGGGRQAAPAYRPAPEYRYERNDSRNDPRMNGGYRGEQADPRYDPRGYGPPPAAAPSPYYSAPRRGGYLGPQGGAVIQDPGRLRLRPAPRGYQWVRTPNGMAMVSQSTGQIFDVVPYSPY